jgi:tRNA(Ile)-lysidine synthase
LEKRLDLAHLPAGARILVAVSGGADSMALLHVLKSLAPQRRWRLTVAHLHHGIRGRAAGRDASFVKAASRALRLPCVVGKADVPALALRDGVSIEMAARRARYAFLARTAGRAHAEVVVTAHTADDQVETFFLKLFRGAGRGALGGIRAVVPLVELAPGVPVPPGQKVVRPLLGACRGEILDYLRRHGIVWREDDSNADPVYLRNRVRHELLPLLEQGYSAGIREVVRKAMDVLAAEEAWLDVLTRDLADRCRAGVVLNGPMLAAHPLAARRRVIRLWLVEAGVPEALVDFDRVASIDGMLSRKAGSQSMDIGMGYRVIRSYTRLSVGQGDAPVVFRARLQVPGETVIPEIGVRVTASLGREIALVRGARPGALPATATVDAGVLGRRVMVVRSRKAGDRMQPYGMTGTKKVQDILVDAGVPRGERDGVPVFECGGEIVWIPGYRIAGRWAVAGDGGRSVKLVMERLSG